MKDVDARKLAIRLNDVMQDWDTYNYADVLADQYDNNEELLLEDLVQQIMNTPETVMNNMLDVMNSMMDCIC